jgi:hypothetical protein
VDFLAAGERGYGIGWREKGKNESEQAMGETAQVEENANRYWR